MALSHVTTWLTEAVTFRKTRILLYCWFGSYLQV